MNSIQSIILTVFIPIIFGFSGPVAVQSQNFLNYTTSDGLVDNNVNCIALDSADNVWLGTQNGLSMFDGSAWTSYTQTSHPSLLNNNITAVHIAADNKVWLGTDFGISVWDGTTFTNYTTTDGLGNNRINSINEDMNGAIWIGEFSGITHYDGSSFTAYGTAAGLPFGGVNDMAFDSNNELWLASGLGGLVHYDGTTFTAISTPTGLLHNVVRAVIVDAEDNKWVATAAGVSVVDTAGVVVQNHTRLLTLPAPDTLNPMEDIALDSKGNIWAGIYVDYLVTEGGVAMYNGSNWIDYDVSDGLVGPVVRQLAIDQQDAVWVATSSGVTKIFNIPNATSNLYEQTIDFVLWPNPVNTYLNVSFNRKNNQEEGIVEIFNTNGILVALYKLSVEQNYLNLPLHNYANGMYWVRFQNHTQAFILQH